MFVNMEESFINYYKNKWQGIVVKVKDFLSRNHLYVLLIIKKKKHKFLAKVIGFEYIVIA